MRVSTAGEVFLLLVASLIPLGQSFESLFDKHYGSENLFKLFSKLKTCDPATHIQNTMMNVTVTEGKEATFKCLMDTSECMVMTSIEWFHEMPNGISKKIRTPRNGDPQILTIEKAERAHAGLYRCEVANIFGKDEASAYLQVNSPASVALPIRLGLLLEVLEVLLLI